MTNMNNVDAGGIADMIIPHVPLLALAWLALSAVGIIVSFVIPGIGAIFVGLGSLAMLAVGYASIIMLHRIYMRVAGR